VHVVEALAGLRLPADVELRDGGAAGFALLDVLAGRRKVVVLDAVDLGARRDHRPAGGGGPGGAAGPAGLAARDWPGRNAAGGRRLGIAPADVVVLGIQPAAVDWGLALSPKSSAVCRTSSGWRWPRSEANYDETPGDPAAIALVLLPAVLGLVLRATRRPGPRRPGAATA